MAWPLTGPVSGSRPALPSSSRAHAHRQHNLPIPALSLSSLAANLKTDQGFLEDPGYGSRALSSMLLHSAEEP